MTNLIARCKDATGSFTTGALLMRIAYWMPKATREFGGHLWIAKSAADWCAETGMSPEQYKTAVARLRQLRLVITEQHKFGGQTITHLRLTWRGSAAVGHAPAPATEGQENPPPEGKPYLPTKGQIPPPMDKGDSSKEVLKGANTGVLTHASRQADQKKKIPGENLNSEGISEPQFSPGILKNPIPENQKSDSENLKEGNTDVQPQHPGSVRDVQQRLAEKLHKPDKVAGLEAAWKKIYGEVHGGFVAAFTAKQRGQLKHFIKACPEGTAAAVLETCLRNWVWFTEAAESAAGIKSSPDKPDVGFLLKHVGTAVNEHLEATQPAAKKWQPKQPIKPGIGKPDIGKPAVQSIAGLPDPDDEFDEATYEPASKAEVMAMLGIEPPPPDTAVEPSKKGDSDES